MPGCHDGLERERSSLRRRSAPFHRARAAKSATLHDNVFFLLVLFFFYSYCFFFIITIVLLVRRASSARASERGDFGSEWGR